MKRNFYSINLALTVLLGLGLVVHEVAARAKFSDWSAPMNLGPIVNSTFNDIGPAISKDGLSLYLGSNRPGGSGGLDIWVSQRANVEDPWGPATNLGPIINTPSPENVPSFSRDGHWMFFNSDRPGGFGGTDMWVSWRAHTHDDFGWQPPVNLGPGVNTASGESVGSYFENAEAGAPLLFFSSNRPGMGAAPGGPYVSALTGDGSFGPATLVTELDSPVDDMRLAIRFDGREIFLASSRPGSLGGRDLWASVRETVFDTWSPPETLGAVVNSASNELTPYLSDRRVLYFASDRPGGFGAVDLYVTTRDR
jgi:WD40-like Beta Propeller Repeat